MWTKTLSYCFLAGSLLAADRNEVARSLLERTGHSLSRPDKKDPLPPGVSLERKLSLSDCVAIALWNNAQLEADLAAIEVAGADLTDAKRIRDPLLQMLIPAGPKRFEFLFVQPIELLWQRQKRIRAATLTMDQLVQSLVQNGLNLARDVKLAHADLLLAEQRSGIAAAAAELRRRILDLGRRRLEAGDITGADLALLEIDARTAAVQAAVFQSSKKAAEERLRMLMGLRGSTQVLSLEPLPKRSKPEANLERAFESRPDLRAARLAIEAARVRAGLERWRPLSLSPGLSVKGSGRDPIRTGPSLFADVPLLNRNAGGKHRAHAELVRAEANLAAVQDRVESELRAARALMEEAATNLDLVQNNLLPAVRASVELAESSFRLGDISRLNVLEATRQLYDVQLREAEAVAAYWRALAELERSVGQDL
jgi:cobalt-zinc-cadmium efflux system outer membrane protein